jgi:transcription antitermination factor NusG
MPILPAEPDMYPASLWDDGGPASDPDRRWWCLHTKPRRDKAVARVLRKRQLVYYLPQIEQVSRTPGGRRIRSILPLFGGYVFLHGDVYDRAEAMHSGHVANVLDVPDQATLQLELSQVHQMLSSGLPVAPEPVHVVGTMVQIVVGPLRGIIGTVVRRGKRDAFIAHVQFLCRGAMVELQDWQVEPVSDSGTRGIAPNTFDGPGPTGNQGILYPIPADRRWTQAAPTMGAP